MKNFKLHFVAKFNFLHLIKFLKPTLVLRKLLYIVHFHCCKIKSPFVQKESPISIRPISVSMKIFISIAAAHLGLCQRFMMKLFAKIVNS